MANKKKHIKLGEIEKKNIFSVPDQYFSSSALQAGGNLVSKKSALSRNIYQIPDQYFEELSFAIVTKIKAEKTLAEKTLKQNVFSVPGLYFEKQVDQILDKISSEKIVGDLKQTMYSVPEEYFDSLANDIQKRTTGKDVYKLPQQDFIPSLNPTYKYAVAAGIAVMIVLGGLRYFYPGEKIETAERKKIPAQISAEKLIAALSKKEIQAYLDLQDNVETADIVEISSQKKKDKIEEHFQQYILPEKLKKKEKQDLEIEIEDINIEDLEI